MIPDDIHGYAELQSFGRIPIAGGEHEYTLYGFRELIEARAVDYIQFDTNRVGGLTPGAQDRGPGRGPFIPGHSRTRARCTTTMW